MKKQKNLLLLFFAILLILLFSAEPAYATPLQVLKNYIISWYNWAFMIIGILATLSFLFGALQYMTSVGGSGTGEGKSRMIGSVLGIVLLFASWLMLKTVNPQLITVSLNPLPAGAGIFYTGSGLAKAPVPLEEPDISGVYNMGYRNISYECTGDGSKVPKLLIWYYGNPGSASATNTFRVNCGKTQAIQSTGRYVLGFESPGIYLFTSTSGCNGPMSQVFDASQNPLPQQWQGVVHYFRIVPVSGGQMLGGGNGAGIGAIFHQSNILSDGGGCTVVYGAADNETCYPVTFRPFSLDVIILSKSGTLSGKGVSFFSKNSGALETQQAGFYNVAPADTLVNSEPFEKDANQMKFYYTGILQTAGQDCPADPTAGPALTNCLCPDFQTCPGSIQIKGDYLVTLYSTPKGAVKPGDAPYFCQSFKTDVPNLGTESFIQKGGTTIYNFKKVSIVPTVSQ